MRKNKYLALSLLLICLMFTGCSSSKNSVTETTKGKKETTSIEKVEKSEKVDVTKVEEISKMPEKETEEFLENTEELKITEEISETENTEESTADFAGSDVMNESWDYLGVYIDGNYFHMQENVYSELEANLLANNWLIREKPLRTHTFYKKIEGVDEKEMVTTTNTDDKVFYELWIKNPQNIELYGGLTQSATRADVKSVWGEPDYFTTELDVRVYDYYVHPTGLYWVEILYKDTSEGMTYDDCQIKSIRFVYEKDNFLSDINRKLKDGTENQLKKSED